MKKVMKFVKGKKEDEPMKVVNPMEPPRKSYSFEKSDDSKEDDFLETDKSITKVHKAVWQENIDKLKTIIKTNDIDITDRLDRTALYFAVMKNNPLMVELLLENDANQNIPDIDGVTPFLKSIELGYIECAVALMNHGADFKRVDKDLNTCLHYAIIAGLPDMVKILLKNGMDCNVHNINGEYPIHTAVKVNNMEMVEMLLKHGAGVNAADCKGTTALMFAASSGYTHIMNLLKKYNADIEIKDGQGNSAVDYATSNGHKDIVVKLRNASIRSLHPKPECSNKTDDSDTWNDSPLSTRSDKQVEKQLSKISEHFFQEETDVSEEKSESDVSVKRSENASPQSGVIPPPCKPLRSLEYLQAGMSSENRPVHLLTLGTVRTRHISMTESEKSNASHRYSYQGDVPRGGSGDSFHSKPPDLLSCIGDEMGDGGAVSCKSKHHSGKVDEGSAIQSDWGSNESLPLDEFKDTKSGGGDSTFLQKQFSILENYEKNHSRNCSVSKSRSRDGSDRDLDDVANFLEDNNHVNCHRRAEYVIVSKKSRSLPRNCQPADPHHTGSMSLPRTLDNGKDFIRDMKRYGSFRPKSHKNDSISSSKKHGFIDRLKSMFGKKSQVHLTTEIQDANNTWLSDGNKDYDTISRKNCSSKRSGISNSNERHSYSERIRTVERNTTIHYIPKQPELASDSRNHERKVTPICNMSYEGGHSRKSSGSRSFSEKISIDSHRLDDELKLNKDAKPTPSECNLFCEECRMLMEMKTTEIKQDLKEKDDLIFLLKVQLNDFKERASKYISEIWEMKYIHDLTRQDLHVMKSFAKKYERDMKMMAMEKTQRKECLCHTTTSTDDVADRWKKQHDVEIESSSEASSIHSHRQLLPSAAVQSLQDENKKLEDHINKLQKELHVSTHRLSEMEITLSSVKTEMNNITYENQKEKEALELELQTTVKKMDEERRKVEKDVKNLQAGYDRLQSIYNETCTAFKESVEQHETFLQENEKLKEENNLLLHKLCDLEKQAASIKGSALIRNKVMFDQLRKSNISFHGSNRSSLEMVNVYYEETKEDGSLETKCICFSDEKHDSTCNRGASLRDIMLEIELLNTEYSEMHIRFQEEELQKTMAMLENENDRLKDRIESQNLKIEEMEATVEELTRENCDGCTKIEEVLDEHEELKTASEQMMSEIEKSRKELATKIKTIKEQETKLAQYIHEIQRWEQNVKDLENERDKRSIKITALETTNGELRSKVITLEDKLMITEGDNQDMKSKCDNLDKEKCSLIEQVHSSEKHILELEQNFCDCKSFIEELKRNNERLVSTINELQVHSVDKELEYEAKIDEFKLKIGTLETENNTLTHNVDEQKKKCDNLLDRLDILTKHHKNEISAKTARNDKLVQENKELTTQIHNVEGKYNNEILDLTTQLKDKIKLCNCLRKELEEIQQNLVREKSSTTIFNENVEMKRAVDVLKSILNEDYENSIKNTTSFAQISSNLYLRLCATLRGESRSSSQTSRIPKLQKRLKCTCNYVSGTCGCQTDETMKRTNSLPILSDDDSLESTHGNNNSKTELITKSTSVDNLLMVNKMNEKQTEQIEQQMELISKLRTELNEVTDKLNTERNKQTTVIKEATAIRDHYYKEIIENLQKQVQELQNKTTKESSKNFCLEADLTKMKRNMSVMSEMELEISKLRSELEKERRARIRDIELLKVKKEQELKNSQDKLKSDFVQIKGKLLADITVAQKALQVKKIEEMSLKEECDKLTKEVSANQEARQKRLKEISEQNSSKQNVSVSTLFTYPSVEPATIACVCAIPNPTQQTQTYRESIRSDLETTIKRHRLQSEKVRVARYPSDEELIDKYLLK